MDPPRDGIDLSHLSESIWRRAWTDSLEEITTIPGKLLLFLGTTLAEILVTFAWRAGTVSDPVAVILAIAVVVAGPASVFITTYVVKLAGTPFRQRNEAREIALAKLQVQGVVIDIGPHTVWFPEPEKKSESLCKGILLASKNVTISNLTTLPVELDAQLYVPVSSPPKARPFHFKLCDQFPPDGADEEHWTALESQRKSIKPIVPVYLAPPIRVEAGTKKKGCLLFSIDADIVENQKNYYGHDLYDDVHRHPGLVSFTDRLTGRGVMALIPGRVIML